MEDTKVENLPPDIQVSLLESFIVNNEDLENLENIIDKFNVFLSLGIIRSEIRHSEFLAWLLSPNQTHGLSDYFLKMFLKSIIAENKSSMSNIDVFKINQWDLDETLVLKEWNNIDILIVNHEHQFVCVIENKVDSKEHSNQLTTYRELIEKKYASFPHKLFLYLTVNGDRPEKEDAYLSVSYAFVAQIVDKLLKSRSSQLNSEVSLFINHYLEMINRYIMEKSEVQNICRQIYQKHQKALDLIYQYKPDIFSEIEEILTEIVDANESLQKDHSSKSSVKFIHKNLDFFPRKGEGWVASKRILLFEILNSERGVFLTLMLGPGDNELRRLIFEAMRVNPMKGATNQLYKKWTTVYKIEIAKIKELQDKTREEMKGHLAREINNFLHHDFHQIQSALEPLRNQFSTTHELTQNA
jgi:hypothetical protein